ncbi:MAG TPA: IPT/TIG domain-containing protein [Candidatus Paceibacterota bacterium]|jgi:hypothetical protein|nr:IPT/TIG domain-containing protein [Candidatus Paceibacterota bacterium]
MNKTNNKSIVLPLGILGILIFGLVVMPGVVSAQYNSPYFSYGAGNSSYTNNIIQNNPEPVISSINPNSSNLGVGTKTVTITGSGFVPSSIARINGSNRSTTFIDSAHLLTQITGNDTYTYRENGGFFISVWNGAPGGGASNAAFFTINDGSATNINNNNGAYMNNNGGNSFTDTPQTGNGNSTNNGYSSLASNAIYGSNSFLPSGIMGWILFAILILIIVILARKIFSGERKYHSEPLKHA